MDEAKRGPVELHDREVARFVERYEQLARDPYASTFTYGRKRIDDVVGHLVGPAAGRRLLDVGCGVGFQLRQLAVRGFRAFGIEPARAMARVAATGATGRVAIADGRALPLRDGSMDVVLCVEVLRYLPDPRSILCEASRVLRPGGLVVLTAVPRWSLDGYALWNAVDQALGLGRTAIRQSFFSQRSLRCALHAAGFGSVRVVGCFLGPFVLLQKLAPARLGMALRRWERWDERLADRAWARPLVNHWVVRAVKEEA
jgi:SAM-dependent methyltransferase